MLFQLKKLPEIINLTRFLKSFWILYIDQIIVYNTFYSTLTFYIIKDRCQMHALKVFRSPVWLLLHKLSSPHYRYIRKMRRGDRLPLTQSVFRYNIFVLLLYIEYKMQHDAIILIYANLAQTGQRLLEPWFVFLFYTTITNCGSLLVNGLLWPLA